MMGFSRIFSVLLLLFITLPTGVNAGNSYVDNGDGTLNDQTSGLMWQKVDDGMERIWEDAVQYCDDLELAGHKDWTLPKIFMLEGLIEPGYSPTIDPVFSVKPSYYWSSSVSRNSANSAKYVNFFYGNTYAYSKDNTYYVLCVRDAAPVNNPLTVDFSYEKDSASDFNIHFNPKIGGGSEPYFAEWDYGDGDTSSMVAPRHEFPGPGNYKVVLTVSDNDGAIAVSILEIVLPLAVDTEDIGTVEKVPAGEVIPPTPVGLEVVVSADSLVTETDMGTLPKGDVLAIPAAAEQEAPDAVTDLEELDAATIAGEVTPSEIVEPLADNNSDSQRAEVVSEVIEVGKSTRSLLRIFAGTGKPLSNSSGQGLLAYSFANALSGDADWNKDNIITVQELKGYLTLAVQNLSEGKQTADISLMGDDFSICAEHGSTYGVVVGVDPGASGLSAKNAGNAELVSKAIESRCTTSKMTILTGKQATRQGILNALRQIGVLAVNGDNIVLYYAGESEENRDRLNLFASDTVPEMSFFTGLFYDDILRFIEGSKAANITVLFEVAAPLVK